MSMLTWRAPASTRDPRCRSIWHIIFPDRRDLAGGLSAAYATAQRTSEFAPAKAEMIRPLADKGWEFARQA